MTGQMVVYHGMVLVMTWPPSGQGASPGQSVTVMRVVVYTVEVVSSGAAVMLAEGAEVVTWPAAPDEAEGVT